MKIKIAAHIHYSKFPWEEKGEYQLFCIQFADDEHRVYIGEQMVEVEVPDDFDPRAQQIAALQNEKQKLMADTQHEITEIDRKISKLQALEYAPCQQ